MKKLLWSLVVSVAAAASLAAQGYGDQGVITAPAKYVADVWLAHKDARGAEAPSQHVTLPLAEGVAGDFLFQPIRFELPQLDPDQGDMQAYLQVYGTLKAAVAPDGRIALSIAPQRRQGLERPNEAASRPGMTAAGRGSKDFVVTDNEAVAMELPAPTSGYYMKSLKGDVSAMGTRALAPTRAAGGRGGGGGGVAVAPVPPVAGGVVARGGGAGAAGGGGGGSVARIVPSPTPAAAGGVAAGGVGAGAVAPRAAAPALMANMPAEPVSVKDGRMVLRTDLFFKGHTTTITVRLRRQ